jgi:ribosomal protein L29
MKAKELRLLSESELVSKEAELRKTLMKLYGQVSTGTPPKNPGEIRQSKRTLAQILTLRGERARSPKQTAHAAKAAPQKPAAPAAKPAHQSQSTTKTQEARVKQ